MNTGAVGAGDHDVARSRSYGERHDRGSDVVGGLLPLLRTDHVAPGDEDKGAEHERELSHAHDPRFRKAVVPPSAER
jgi:hypothetical protein